MRRIVLGVVAVLAATLLTVPAARAQQAADTTAVPDASTAFAAEDACITAALDAGASPAAAAGDCLDETWTVRASATDASCVHSVQTPWKYTIGVISWGSLIICNVGFVGAGAGTLYWNGLPVSAGAGPSAIPGSAIQFFTTYSPCALTGNYQSSVLSTAVTINGSVVTMGSNASSVAFIACP